MGYIKYLALAALAVADDSKVIVLTDKAFDETITENNKGLLVEFYAPWCGHCKALAPHFDEASITLDGEGSPYKLAKVDATVETEAAKKFGVQGYPTLKWFQGLDSVMDYDGPREAKGIVEWIKTMTGPAVNDGAPEADAASATVTLYADAVSDDFESLAKAQRKAASWHHVKGSENKIVIQHPTEDPISKPTSELDTKAKIEEFYKANSMPLVGEINGESFGKYVERKDFGLIWVLLAMKAETFKDVVAENRPMLKEIAQALPNYSTTFTNTAEFGNVMDSMFGVKEFPKVVIQKKAGGKKYFLYDGDMEAAKIIDHIKKIDSGEIEPNLKSEEAPKEPQADPVKVIVGSTLKEKVFTADKDVLLEVYAPWCGHCKKLDPEYTKVAKKVEREGFEDKLTIAKMDGTANDSPVDSIEWSGFPTIVFVKKGSEEVMSFDGERTAKGIWKWLKTNSSYSEEINAHIAKKKETDGGEDAKSEL